MSNHNIDLEFKLSEIIRRRVSNQVARLSLPSVASEEDEKRFSATVKVNDFGSKWELDIESGNIEQELYNDADGDDEKYEKEHKANNNNNCCRRGCRNLKDVNRNGGDALSKRLPAALRASMGSLIFFSVVIFARSPYLGAAWIGNIFMHTTIKDNVGSSLTAVRAFAKSIIITTLFTMPIQYSLSMTPQLIAQIIFPPITFILSFLIMSCPWLTAPNLMVLVMYVAAAAPLRFETYWWEPLGYLGSYLIGLAVALLMNLLPFHKPNSATRHAHELMQRLDKDFFLLFMQSRYYTFNTGKSPKVARRAGATIDLLVKRINPTIKKLKSLLPAVKAEAISAQDKVKAERFSRWINHLDKASSHFKMLRSALNQRYLGESNGNDAATIDTQYIRQTIASELGMDYHEFINSLIATIVGLNKHADPCMEASNHEYPEYPELSKRLLPCQEALATAVHKVTEQLEQGRFNSMIKITPKGSKSLNESPSFVRRAQTMPEASKIPIYAHLARRMTSLYSLFTIAEGLIDFMSAAEDKDNKDCSEKEGWQHRLAFAACESAFKSFHKELRAIVKSQIDTWWAPKWKWRDRDGRRIALKTALGMLVASLWMAVPYLWDRAEPFGFWPGLTIASVNLSTTGSSFHKAFDRLVGTLFAACYAMIIADFTGLQDYVKIPAIAVFTFAVIWMKKADHAYAATYAATSIGSMLYGSVKNDYNIGAYVPKRIQLIFVGVFTFTIIELFLFPRSSRKIVEAKSIEFFDQISKFLKQAGTFAKVMQHTGREEERADIEPESFSDDEGQEGSQPEYKTALGTLVKVQSNVKATSATLKKEITSALQEPHFGFHQALNAQALSALVAEITEAEVQSSLLVDALKKLSSFIHERTHEVKKKQPCPTSSKPRPLGFSVDFAGEAHTFYRKKNKDEQSQSTDEANHVDWFHAYASFINIASGQMDICQNNLVEAYPDGRFRPQTNNSLKAILAASSFRDFHDIRFNIVSEWSQYCQKFGFHDYDDDTRVHPHQLPVLGITTSFLLELCRHMQLAGLKMEWYIQSFPSS